MPAVQTSYAERHPIAYPGMVADMVNRNAKTLICTPAAGIGFGLVVGRGSRDKDAVLGGPVTGVRGITIADITTIVIGVGTPDLYAQYSNMAVHDFGYIWCVPGANVNDGDPVFYNPTTGQCSNAGGAATVAAPTFAGTGNGVMTLATPAYGAAVVEGAYTATVIEPAANGGTFEVFNPAGDSVGFAVVGTPFVGPVHFTIADGSTDFVMGDTFTIGVTMAAEGPIPGASWKDTALSGGLSRVHLGIMLP